MLAQCEISDGKLTKAFPPGTLIEGRAGSNQATIRFSLNADCPARNKPLTVCIDLWETTACPPDAQVNQCQGNVRGSTGFMENQNWVRGANGRICNPLLGAETDIGGGILNILNSLQFLYFISDDNIKADRQNYLIVAVYDPFRYLKIPIQDDD